MKSPVLYRTVIGFVDANALQSEIEQIAEDVSQAIASGFQQWTEPGFGCGSGDCYGCCRSTRSTGLCEKYIGDLLDCSGDELNQNTRRL